MKKLLILSSFLCLNLSVFAQKDNIKGRFLVLPTNLFAYAFGAAYESQINPRVSAQLSMNFYGIDMQNTDGGATAVVSIIPEARWWTKPVDLEKNKNLFFVGAFLEFAKTQDTPGGERELNDDYLISKREHAFNPGLILGYKVWFSKKWFFETYAGPKYRFFQEKSDFKRMAETVSEKRNGNQLGYRVGLNVGVILK